MPLHIAYTWVYTQVFIHVHTRVMRASMPLCLVGLYVYIPNGFPKCLHACRVTMAAASFRILDAIAEPCGRIEPTLLFGLAVLSPPTRFEPMCARCHAQHVAMPHQMLFF